jgi:hypothetical protein
LSSFVLEGVMSQHEDDVWDPAPWCTGDGVRAILRKTVKQGRLPSHDACASLALSIKAVAFDAGIGRIAREADEIQKQIAAALMVLADATPRLQRLCVWSLEDADILARLVSTGQAAQPLMRRIGFTDRRDDRWHTFAGRVESAFREAMRTANPGLPLALSNSGAVVRFLETVIPQITGEEPSRDAIARYLQRQARKPASGDDNLPYDPDEDDDCWRAAEGE